MKTKNKWIKEIDLIKAFAIVLIVFSHLHDSLNIGSYNNILLGISNYLALIGLSLFFFVSGFSLYYNYNSIPFKNLAGFYRKRAVRIYPLFWLAIAVVAVIFFFSYGFPSTWGGYSVGYDYFIVALLGLQGIFYQGTPSVLYWFVGVLLIYYFIYPFLIYFKDIKKMFLISLLIYGFFALTYLKLNLICFNFFVYFWPFVLGIVLCWLTYHKNLDLEKIVPQIGMKFKKMGLLVLFLIFTIAYFSIPFVQASYLKYFIILLSPLLCIISIYYATVIYKDIFVGKIHDVMSKLSFSTYATFLFFNPILFIVVVLLTKYDISVEFIDVIVVVLGIPLVFFMGYYIQKLELKIRLKLR